MPHPIIEEFCRIRGLGSMRDQTFNRMQRLFQSEIQPLLDEREALLIEVTRLRARVAELESLPLMDAGSTPICFDLEAGLKNLESAELPKVTVQRGKKVSA